MDDTGNKDGSACVFCVLGALSLTDGRGRIPEFIVIFVEQDQSSSGLTVAERRTGISCKSDIKAIFQWSKILTKSWVRV